MERAIKEFKTKGGVDIKAYTYITGREMKELRDCYIKDADVNVSNQNKDVNLSGVKADIIRKYEDMSVKLIVVSINGVEEDINKLVDDLPLADYDDVMDFVTSLTSAKKEESDTSKA